MPKRNWCGDHYRKSFTRKALQVFSILVGLISLSLLLWGIWGTPLTADELGTLRWPHNDSKSDTVIFTDSDFGVYFTTNTLKIRAPPAFPDIFKWGTFLRARLSLVYPAAIEYNNDISQATHGQLQYAPACGLVNVDNGLNYTWQQLCPPPSSTSPTNTCALQNYIYKYETGYSTLVQSSQVLTTMGTVVSSSPAFETEFVFDYKGTNNWFVQGFCTGDAPTWINPSETSNIVTFNLTGRVQAAWGFYVFSGIFTAFFFTFGIFVI